MARPVSREDYLGGGRCILVDDSHSAIVFADEPASSQVSITGADVATSVQQEPKPDAASRRASQMAVQRVRRCELSAGLQSSANHLFRSRSTAFKVDELDLNMAGAGVKKLASGNSRWGMELACKPKFSESFAGLQRQLHSQREFPKRAFSRQHRPYSNPVRPL